MKVLLTGLIIIVLALGCTLAGLSIGYTDAEGEEAHIEIEEVEIESVEEVL